MVYQLKYVNFAKRGCRFHEYELIYYPDDNEAIRRLAHK